MTALSSLQEQIEALTRELAVTSPAAESFHRRMIAAEAEVARLRQRVEEQEVALGLFDEALTEAEAILGGEYAMHHGVLFDKADAARRARKEKNNG